MPSKSLYEKKKFFLLPKGKSWSPLEHSLASRCRVVSRFLSRRFHPKSRWLFPFYFSNITLKTDLLTFAVTGTVFKIAGEMRQLPAYFDNTAIIMTKMAKINSLFMTKTAEKPHWRFKYLYSLYEREYPPPLGDLIDPSFHCNANTVSLLSNQLKISKSFTSLAATKI